MDVAWRLGTAWDCREQTQTGRPPVPKTLAHARAPAVADAGLHVAGTLRTIYTHAHGLDLLRYPQPMSRWNSEYSRRFGGFGRSVHALVPRHAIYVAAEKKKSHRFTVVAGFRVPGAHRRYIGFPSPQVKGIVFCLSIRMVERSHPKSSHSRESLWDFGARRPVDALRHARSRTIRTKRRDGATEGRIPVPP